MGMRIRRKMVVLSVLLSLGISLAVGYSIYYVAIENYTQLFLKSKLDLAKAIAASIDAKVHETLVDEKAKKNPEYQRYLRYLNSVTITEPIITYLYTLYYDKINKQFIYAIDAQIAKSDIIWVETQDFAFDMYLKNGELLIEYDRDTYKGDFDLLKDGKKIGQIEVQANDGLYTITLDETVILEFEKSEKLSVKTRSGLLDHTTRTIEGEIPYGKGKMAIYYYLSVKGESQSEPGTVFQDTEANLKKQMDIFQSNQDYIDEQPIYNIYGRTWVARGIIRDTSGNPSGIVNVELHEKDIEQFRYSIVRSFVLVVVPLTILVFILVYAGVEKVLIRPLKSIIGRVKEIEEGEMSGILVLKTGDEFEMLADNLNMMAIMINSQTLDLETQAKSFERFVPKEFLKQLGKAVIPTISLGDSIEKEMTVLFSDIWSFTAMSEKMAPRDIFTYLNRYLEKAGPIIRSHGGFIDKFIGDAIMALFPGNPRNAVDASVALVKAVEEFNQENEGKNLPILKIGVGIHIGRLILGTIGEMERMDGTVISDAVNATSRIESLTRVYQTSILVSGEIMEKLGENPYQSRYMDTVALKGKEIELKIYQIIPD